MKQIITFCLLIVACTGYAQSDSALCDQIEKYIDKFERSATLYTPTTKDCSLSKVIKGKVITYYLSLSARGSTVSFAKKGVKIIFSNDQRLSFPGEDIDVKVNDKGDYTYSAFIRLTSAQLQLIKKQKITDWQLYVYTWSQSEKDAEDFRTYVNCIIGLE